MNGNQNEILTWLEKLIGLSEEFFLPLKKLHQELLDNFSISLPSLAELKEWIEADGRFDLIDMPGDLGGYSPAREKEMEKLGFFRGCRVGLKNRRPTPQQIREKLEKHGGQLIESLQKAYQARPQNSQAGGEIEDKLLELLQQAKKLKDELTGIFSNGSKRGKKKIPEN